MGSDLEGHHSKPGGTGTSAPLTSSSGGGSYMTMMPVRPGRPWGAIVVGVLGVLVAVTWAIAGRMLLASAGRKHDEMMLERAANTFDYRLTQMEERLRVESRLLGDEPRLRSTLATAGIDENTILDILKDMQKLAEVGLMAVLSPAGRVEAVIGQDSFHRLDFSTSRLFKEARDASLPATGFWVIGERVFQVAVFAVRFQDRTVAYLVEGHALDERSLAAANADAGVGVGVAVSGKIATAVPDDAERRPAFERAVQIGAPGVISFEEGSKSYLAKTRALEGTLPRVDIVWLRAPSEPLLEYEVLGYLLWAPTLIAIALALLFTRQRWVG